MASLPHKHKIVIAGNHELSFDPETLEEARDYMRQEGREEDTHKSVAEIKSLLTNCHILQLRLQPGEGLHHEAHLGEDP